jgi:hypothetical protein
MASVNVPDLSREYLTTILAHPCHLVRTLECKTVNTLAKQEALAFIDNLLGVAPDLVPPAVVQSLSALAETDGETLRLPALFLLNRLAITSTDSLVGTVAFSTLTNSVLDARCVRLRETIVLTIMQLADKPSGRKTLKVSGAVKYLVAPLLQLQLKNQESVAAAADAVRLMMKTCTGIYLLSSSKVNALKALVSTLTHPVDVELQLIVLSLFRNVLKDSQSCGSAPCLGLVLLSLLNAGLVSGLVHVSYYHDSKTSILAMDVLANFILCAKQTLPKGMNDRLLCMPNLMAAASQKASKDRETRLRGLRAASVLEYLARSAGVGVYRTQVKRNVALSGDHFVRLAQTMQNSHRAVDTAMKMIGETQRNLSPIHTAGGTISLGDHKRVAFFILQQKKINSPFIPDVQAELRKSGVNISKEVFDWHWPTIAGLFDGALHNQNHLLETMKTHDRFIRRLAGFFRGSAVDERAYFCRLPWKRGHMPYASILCQMMGLLMETHEGEEFIQRDRRGRLLHALVDELKAVATGLPVANSSRGEASFSATSPGSKSQLFLFSRTNVTQTMVREYFTLIGYMSSTLQGETMLQTAGLIKEAVRLAEIQSKDYISRLLISNLDLSRQGSPSQFYVSTILDSNLTSLEIKIHSLHAVGASLLSRGTTVSSPVSWGIQVMCKQLCGPSFPGDDELATIALGLLGDFFSKPSNENSIGILLETLEQSPPTKISQARFVSSKLFVAIIGCEGGLAVAESKGWVEPALAAWTKPGGLHDKAVCTFEEEIARKMLGRSTKSMIDAKPIRVCNPNTELDGDQLVEGGNNMDWFLRLPWWVEVSVSDTMGRQDFGTDMTLSIDETVGRIRGHLLNVDRTRQPMLLRPSETISISATLKLGSYTMGQDGSLISERSVLDQPFQECLGHQGTTRERKNSSFSATISKTLSQLEQKLKVDSLRAKMERDEEEVMEAMDTCMSSDLEEYVRNHGDQVGTVLRVPRKHSEWIFSRTDASSEDWYLVAIEFCVETIPAPTKKVRFPASIFSALARTARGSKLLREELPLSDLLQKALGAGESPPSLSDQRKSMWAISQICSQDYGYQTMTRVESFFLKRLLALTSSDTFSIRATCLHVLGALSKSPKAVLALRRYGWEKSDLDSAVLPIHHEELFRDIHDECREQTVWSGKEKTGITEDVDKFLLSLAEMTNPVSSKDAARKLKALHVRKAPLLSDSTLIDAVYGDHLAKLHLKLQARRFLHEILGNAGTQ